MTFGKKLAEVLFVECNGCCKHSAEFPDRSCLIEWLTKEEWNWCTDIENNTTFHLCPVCKVVTEYRKELEDVMERNANDKFPGVFETII